MMQKRGRKGGRVGGVYVIIQYSLHTLSLSLSLLDIHLQRPHQGQLLVAGRLRSLLDSNVHPSEIRGLRL